VKPLVPHQDIKFRNVQEVVTHSISNNWVTHLESHPNSQYASSPKHSIRCQRYSFAMAWLSDQQRLMPDVWLGHWKTIDDHSWPLQDTVVLHVRNFDGDHIVKASLTSHHIAREIDAYENVISNIAVPAPRLEHAAVNLGILVTSYLPGDLIMRSPGEWSQDVYRQAGAILALLQVSNEISDAYFDNVTSNVRTRLDAAAGLVANDQLEALKIVVSNIRSHLVQLHFTHGDYQPRNWLAYRGVVSVIDFGRGAKRSWVSDLVRLRNQQFVGHPELEQAFMDGLSRTLTEADLEMLALETVSESLGTVVWAHGIGDQEFEEHGRRMIARILESA